VIQHYLNSSYCRHGRGPNVYDCWGLVREARAELFGKPLLASYGEIDPDDKRSLTGAASEVNGRLRLVGPVPGAIAEGWRCRLCIHVGIVVEVDGRRWILETGHSTGPVLTRIRDFESQYLKVMYYDD
jgi:hypothetical protein